MEQKKHKVYLIPGQGADYRLYNNLVIDRKFEAVHIDFIRPEKGVSMYNYARLLAQQIDTTDEYSIIGVSLGGMLAVELTELLNPQTTIIISSAKNRPELPGRYRFMRYFPVNKIIPSFLYKAGAKVAQPLIEPDRKYGKEIFIQMLNDKDAKFLKRSANMIINWKRKDFPDNIYHIHGTNDHTIPHKNVDATHCIEGGSHMMVLTRGSEISKIVNRILLKNT